MKPSPIRVSIKSYQSIEGLEFDVTGFTCVTGPTNIGKSAIMRAISGALLNKPVTNLVRTGSKQCSVRLASEQWGLLWEKAEKGVNRYTIDGKAEKLENVGQRQPEPIASMGFGSVRIGDRDLYPWYASQWTPVFLLDEGGPTVTQFISEISGLDILQNAITLGLKGKKKALDDFKLVSVEADQFKLKLKKVSKLDELVAMTNELESQAESIAEYERRVERGRELLTSTSEAAAMIDVMQRVTEIEVPPNGMGNEISTALNMYHRWVKLEEAAKSIISLHGKTIGIPELPCEQHDTWTKIRKYAAVDRLKSSVEKLDPIEYTQLPKQLSGLEVNEIKQAQIFRDNIEKLRKSTIVLSSSVPMPAGPKANELDNLTQGKTILSEIEKASADVSKLGKTLSQIDKGLGDVLKELDAIPSCPTCNRPMIQEHLH
jgi:DNA repair exonuclease SbcCD ATPase subunit